MDWAGLRRAGASQAGFGVIEALVRASVPSPALEQEAALAAAGQVVDGLANSDLEDLIRGARDLAGLGEGRTPAGDDFLMGALHALWLLVPAERARLLGDAVAEAAAPRTTTLSSEWLRAAARGEAIPVWGDLLTALAAGDRGGIDVPLARVAATGHSSGLASLAGFVAAWRALSARSPG